MAFYFTTCIIMVVISTFLVTKQIFEVQVKLYINII